MPPGEGPEPAAEKLKEEFVLLPKTNGAFVAVVAAEVAPNPLFVDLLSNNPDDAVVPNTEPLLPKVFSELAPAENGAELPPNTKGCCCDVLLDIGLGVVMLVAKLKDGLPKLLAVVVGVAAAMLVAPPKGVDVELVTLPPNWN